MPRLQEFQLHPNGWENDPEEERFKLSTLDYLSTTCWVNPAFFFRLQDSQKPKVVSTIKTAFERVLSQARHLVGTIERDDAFGHSIVRKRTSTVQFVVQHLDGPEDDFPSFEKIEKAHFMASAFDIATLSNAPMTYGEKPEAHPDAKPALCSVKVNLIKGGLVLNIHTHHFANALHGNTHFIKLIGRTCYALVHGTELPSFDPSLLDRTFFQHLSRPDPSMAVETMLEAPPRADRHPQHKPSITVMFHLPNSKAVRLKEAASIGLGSETPWISTYDAVCALMWRVLTRIRVPLYQSDLKSYPLWGSGVDMVPRFGLPDGIQGNCSFDIVSAASTVPPFTVAEIVSEVPLSKLASYGRQITSSVTPEMVVDAVHDIAKVRNKWDLSIRLDSLPPLTLILTDWRTGNHCTVDWGFGKPIAYRHLFDRTMEGLSIVYPRRNGPAGKDEGLEVLVTVEKELLAQLVNDADWAKYFEYRGVDADTEPVSAPFFGKLSKL